LLPPNNSIIKNSIKNQWPKPSLGRLKGKAKERPKDAQPPRTKKKGKS
jgi:hypothetical protein